MKLDWRLVLVIVLSLGLMVSCESTDDEETDTAFEILTKYMVEQDLDATTIVSDFYVPAADVAGSEAEYFIVDVRADTAFARGHVPSAINCAYGNVLTTVEAQNTGDLPVLVVCYTGQSAAHAVVALRLSGYTAKILLFGMSGWHSQFDSWSGNTGDIAVDDPNWSMDAAPAFLSDNDDPIITTDQTDGAAILAERVEAILDGFKGTPAQTILDDPASYEIINYWGATDYDHYGHIDGAYQVTPGTLTIADDGLDILDPALPIATYCWTGQTSSMMTAWLTAIGYNATSLKFGANAMIYSVLDAHKWGAISVNQTIES